MRADDTLGMVGCRLVGRDGQPDFNAKRSIPRPSQALVHFAASLPGLGRLGERSRYRTPELGYEDVGEVEAISGSFMLVRTAAMRQVGIFDERYWMYGEDLDWCERFRRGGWRILYDGRHAIVHVKGGVTGRHRRLRQNVEFHRAMGRFYRKFQAGRRPALDALVYLGIGVRLVTAVVASAWARRGGATGPRAAG
jgi:hypothetical protein